MRMKDRIVVLTAAASGIGLASSRLIAQEGARLVLADINDEAGEKAAEQIRAGGGDAIFVRTDVAVEDSIRSLFDRVVEEYGRIDVLFNGVGINMGKPVTDCTADDFDAVVTLNLRSVFLASKYVLPHLLENPNGGVIVNNASMGGLVGRPGDPLYVATKHGVNGLTKSLALNYADQGVRVNSVCPGTIATPLLFENLSDDADRTEFLKKAVASSPTPRAASPEEVAKAVLFLASDDSSFINGVALAVDGAKSAGLLKGDRYSLDFDMQVSEV